MPKFHCRCGESRLSEFYANHLWRCRACDKVRGKAYRVRRKLKLQLEEQAYVDALKRHLCRCEQCLDYRRMLVATRLAQSKLSGNFYFRRRKKRAA
jgi:hypothetical protein